jgi:uroporphyrinogen-III decarboxylase
LESATFNAAEGKEWLQFIKELWGFGGFILSSSCGIHTLNHMKNLKHIYECIDALNRDDIGKLSLREQMNSK